MIDDFAEDGDFFVIVENKGTIFGIVGFDDNRVFEGFYLDALNGQFFADVQQVDAVTVGGLAGDVNPDHVAGVNGGFH